MDCLPLLLAFDSMQYSWIVGFSAFLLVWDCRSLEIEGSGPSSVAVSSEGGETSPTVQREGLLRGLTVRTIKPTELRWDDEATGPILSHPNVRLKRRSE